MHASDSHGLLLQRINNIVTMDKITYPGYPSNRKTISVVKPLGFHNSIAALKIK